MKPFFRLIRIKNLLIIAATQYLMRYAILNPILKSIDVSYGNDILKVPELSMQMTDFQFLCLVLATCLITAAGYVINDYFDTKTDLINRPGRVVVGKTLSRRMVMAIHIVLNTIGIGFGFYVSFSIGKPFFGFVFVFVTGLLWFYSTTYKRQFLIGNLLVAFLTGMVPFMVAAFEIQPLLKEYTSVLVDYKISLFPIVAWIGGFSFFAFFLTLIRELIKDMEDFKGDKAFGRRSVPVVLGLKGAKIMVLTLISLTILALVFVGFLYLKTGISLIYIALVIILPMIILAIRLIRTETSKGFHDLSNFTKIIMLAGIGYAGIASYIFMH
ncbi:MAG: geranylgeranylglycerol-phosphate geranylgeranyltransferase [Bacteroidales bacterium]|nr:geranylgeranylglycerol-phosphate geranylgeranyltransferase [Bacteroidales bacterium]